MIRENIKLAPLTYYKIGGPARFLATPENQQDLAEVSAFLKNNSVPFFILGAGSNVLISDQGFDGLVIHAAKLERTLTQIDPTTLDTGAGIMVIQLLRHCMKAGISGFEFLVGIPGSMGGVLYMNAGTKLGEVDSVVQEITAYDLTKGSTRVIRRNELQYSYRTQHFLKKSEIILRAKLLGQPSDPKTVQNSVQELLSRRKTAQPIDKPSCGSVFKNPDPQNGIYAWKLISDAGLRGHRIGNAQISTLHTNFIVNLGGATAADVRALIDEARRRVHDATGIALETEVKILD